MDISLDALPQHASFHGRSGLRRGPFLFLLLGVLVRLFWSTLFFIGLHYMDEC